MDQAIYGQEGMTYVVFIPMKSLAEVDQAVGQDKQFADAIGEDGMKRLGELEASSIEYEQTNMFQFNAAMSYPRQEWIKADPDFWKPAAAAKAPAKTEKPAAKP